MADERVIELELVIETQCKAEIMHDGSVVLTVPSPLVLDEDSLARLRSWLVDVHDKQRRALGWDMGDDL